MKFNRYLIFLSWLFLSCQRHYCEKEKVPILDIRNETKNLVAFTIIEMRQGDFLDNNEIRYTIEANMSIYKEFEPYKTTGICKSSIPKQLLVNFIFANKLDKKLCVDFTKAIIVLPDSECPEGTREKISYYAN